MWVFRQPAWKALLENTYGCAPKHTREGSLKVVLETPRGLGWDLASGPGPEGETLSPLAIQEGRM